MDTVATIILNYKRQENVKNIILPSVLKNTFVSTIIIAHGLQESVFGVGPILHFFDISNADLFSHTHIHDEFACDYCICEL